MNERNTDFIFQFCLKTNDQRPVFVQKYSSLSGCWLDYDTKKNQILEPEGFDGTPINCIMY